MVNKYYLEPNPRDVKSSKGDELYISVRIGNGQEGANLLTLDGEKLAKGDFTDPTFIGTFEDMVGKEIELTTNVLDVNSFTNMCVITTKVLNHNNEELFSKIDKGEAEENGLASFIGHYFFRVIIFMILFLGAENLTIAQSSGLTPIENLQTPTSPGFILLDQTPSAIERPSTPQGFGASLLSFFNGNGGAIEVAPFWLTTHANLTAKELALKKMPILENLSFSGATIESDSLNYLTGGIRTRFISILNAKQVKQLDTVRKQIIEALSTDVDNLDLTKIEALRKQYVALTTKPTFSADIAVALGAGSMNNSFSDLNLSRWSAWLNLNFRPGGNDFYFTTLVRFTNNESFEGYTDNSNLVDIGSRFNYDIGKFSLSLEYLQRINSATNNFDNRVAAIGNYKLSNNFYLTSTFGKNFTNSDNIIALLGINFGFSVNKMKAY